MPNANITKRVIAGAMKDLMQQKPLAKISVGDIVTACEINRNSFYYHFKDKYDLVNWIFYTELTQTINNEMTQASSGQALVECTCNFFYQNKAFYQNALSVSGQNSFAEYFIDWLKTFLLAQTQGIFQTGEEREFFATFFADAFAISLYRWLASGAKIPPQKFAALAQSTAAQAAAIFLEEELE